jgi:hypothetical protein
MSRPDRNRLLSTEVRTLTTYGVVMLASCVLILLAAPACEKEDVISPNQPPETTLANVPLENGGPDPEYPDTLYFALLRVSWDGEDEDGYVAGYEYRWTTYHRVAGDSIPGEWSFTTIADTTFAFESSDSINEQYFQVRAIDNDGACDPTPATRWFKTARVEHPETWITSPDSGSTVFILNSTTDTWDGILLSYGGEDTDGEVAAFSWRTDGRSWSDWATETTRLLVASDFAQPIEGPHTISVKSQDNTMVEDPSPASIPVELVLPTFAEAILVVDETKDGTGLEENPTDEQVDSYYDSLLVEEVHTNWDYIESGMPGPDVLGQYRVVLWHTDDVEHEIVEHQEEVAAYLNVGGKLILSGWRVLYSFSSQYETTWLQETFPRDYLHIGYSKIDTRPVWTGALGMGAYEGYEARPDSAKLRSNRHGRLVEVAKLEPLPPFCEGILAFQHLQGDTVYQDQPCAAEYAGTTYDVVFFAFPLFYTAAEYSTPLVQFILERWGE